ncbi:thioredoxin domain-containing protein [Synechococcus sp. Nb3U1]|uniref:thioredoxin domain-containing protein n=1 Tax=Synechococcus sp. Nb3U1 TaxID=1914529 RepID=UPI001F1ACB00|nr:thioredoxin domain-containing protein [Synechococcus sp. Nb3U1]MCF2970617.1 thioredoxin domain-containing protein [Synechococcus sp. Nb3U1]
MSESWAKRLRNGLIALAAVILATGLFLANQSRSAGTSLEALAQRAVPLEQAQTNAKPSLVEFYADWCTSCRSMAPVLASLKEEFAQQVNFVMLNVDNPKWLPELSRYRVNGIPHFLFLDQEGELLGSAIGEQPESVLRANLLALATGEPLDLAGSGPVSGLDRNSPVLIEQPDPRSHG